MMMMMQKQTDWPLSWIDQDLTLQINWLAGSQELKDLRREICKVGGATDGRVAGAVHLAPKEKVMDRVWKTVPQFYWDGNLTTSSYDDECKQLRFLFLCDFYFDTWMSMSGGRKRCITQKAKLKKRGSVMWCERVEGRERLFLCCLH